jgi:hypothetical protein
MVEYRSTYASVILKFERLTQVGRHHSEIICSS